MYADAVIAVITQVASQPTEMEGTYISSYINLLISLYALHQTVPSI